MGIPKASEMDVLRKTVYVKNRQNKKCNNSIKNKNELIKDE